MSELSPDTRAFLEAHGRDDAPRAEDRARIRQRLALELGAGALASAAAVTVAAQTAGPVLATSVSAAASKASVSLGVVSKMAMAAALLGAISAGAFMAWSPSSEDSKVQRAPQILRASKTPLLVREAEEAHGAQTEQSAIIEPLAEDSKARPVKRSAHDKSRAEMKSDNLPESDMAGELTLLREANLALRAGRPTDALKQTAEHAARFPHGALREERVAVDMLARCAQGSHDQAMLTVFLETAPESPLKARVRSACEGR